MESCPLPCPGEDSVVWGRGSHALGWLACLQRLLSPFSVILINVLF